MLRLGDTIDLTAEQLVAELAAGNIDTEVAGIEEHYGSVADWAELCAADHTIYTAST